ncbi:MAG TPA: erythromycin esterase family protein [Polyangia bacterium]|jgi:erythromycin esterase-like protein/predicted phosphoribosyltransferase|nr:erythromycin esterase family protein [Polyangia bacterium]
MRPFANRREAGQQLAAKLTEYAGRSDVIVLGLPRGGIPVAAEVARALGATLDVFVVRKLGVPGHEELAMGAIASGGVKIVNQRMVRQQRVSSSALAEITARENRELERRERAYRNGRPLPELAGKIVILVDDGLATGASMLAAITALRSRKPARIVAAAPVASAEACHDLGAQADQMVCLETPAFFLGVGQWYEDFTPTTDDEVRAALGSGNDPTRPTTRSRNPPTPGTSVEREAACADAVRKYAIRLRGEASDYDEILQRLSGARVVLIGEASHGTHEFYRARAELTQRLITEKGFRLVAAEADWPDAYRVNRYLRGQSDDADGTQALGGFVRFPAWMWRNADVLDFIGWLRDHNDQLANQQDRAGFYGLDLYSLFGSIQAVLGYLEKVDPPAAARARGRYACFDHFGADSQQYGFQVGLGITPTCEDQVLAQLADLRRQAVELPGAAPMDEDERFFAEQNARVVFNAEAYYRAMFRGRVSSWNLRDRHMMETLQALLGHFGRTDRPPKAVIWAHNSHLGDARATDMGRAGEFNLGQLARQEYGSEGFSIGFTTHEGTVTAAADWDQPAERKRVRPALPHSYEAVLHATGLDRFLLMLNDNNEAVTQLQPRRLERAIGVIYRPETERVSHYFEASLPRQFDAVIHIDHTSAVEPLERTGTWQSGDVPETFPSAV